MVTVLAVAIGGLACDAGCTMSLRMGEQGFCANRVAEDLLVCVCLPSSEDRLDEESSLVKVPCLMSGTAVFALFVVDNEAVELWRE